MKTKNRNRRISLAALIFAMLVLTPAAMAATVTTDQEDYAPWELVTINGSGFEPLAPITLTIEWPDGYVDEFYGQFDASWNFIWTSTTCDDPSLYGGAADDQGNFYLLFGKELMEGTFTVVATDGTNTATTTFTDAISISSVFTSNPGGTLKSSFTTADNVYAVVVGGGSASGPPPPTVRIYVVASPLPAQNGALVDVSGGYETQTISVVGNNGPYLIWPATTVAGNYYVVIDADQGGTYGSNERTYSFTITAPADTTPPVAGTVNDGPAADIDTQTSTTTISANWSGFSDAESGIAGYEWAIGTTSGGTDAQGFTSIGTATSASNSSLTLISGTTYYVTVRATNGVGLQITATSDGVLVQTPVETAGITFYQSGVGGDFAGTVLTIDGANYGVGDLPKTITKNVGQSISFEYYSPLGVDAGKQYVWTSTTGLSSAQSGSISVESGGGSVTGGYKTQYYLILDSNPALVGTQTGGGWYDDGDTANISTDENVDIVSGQSRYHFTDWSTDDMDEIGDEFAASTTVLVDKAKTVTANYVTQYYLTLDSSPSSVGTQTGEGWYDDGDTADISTDENVDIISGQSRYHFADWSTDDMDEIGDEFAASTTVLVDKAKTVTANYVTQYLVTFAQTGLDGTATGTVVTVDGDTKEYGDLSFAKWVDSGDTVEYEYEILVNSSVLGFQFWLSSVTGSASPITVTSPVTVTGNYTHLPLSAITAGGCPFDRDADLDGQQFRLIFTQDPTNISTYKLTASNPGQFFYNVFFVGTPDQTASLSLDIPFPFVTQGAMPVHVYKSVSVVDGCFVPADEILVLPALGGNSPNHSINVTVPDTGLVYVRVHLDYGLKKEVGYTKDTSNNAEKPVGTDAISDLTSYVFGVSGDTSDTQTIENMNVFKRNPGFGGLVTGSVTGDTLANVEVKIYTSAKKLLATVTTDEDGFYYYYYKHTGKSATYYIEVNGVPQPVTVKANGLAMADFQI